jgi:hypothetical protein
MNQNKAVHDFLKSRKQITPMEALSQLGVFRLASRIFDINKMGVRTKTIMVYRGKKKYAKYVYLGG